MSLRKAASCGGEVDAIAMTCRPRHGIGLIE